MAFQPGNKGGGKRKEKMMFDALMVALKRIQADDRPAYAHIADQLVTLAISGDIQAIKEINNRIDGMPTQQIETVQEVHYVAELPPVAETTEEWLKQNNPQQTVQ